MRKFTAFILAAGLFFGIFGIEASAAEYGRNPEYSKITAQGEYIYYFEDGAIWESNIVSRKRRTV